MLTSPQIQTTLARSVLLAAAVCSIIVQDSAAQSSSRDDPESKRTTSSHDMAVGLIDQAARAAGDLEPESQALLLSLAGKALATVDPEKAKTYYALAFDASEKMLLTTKTNSRVVVQTAVVNGLSNLDLEKSLDLLRRVDKPSWTQDSEEDFRTFPALVLVAKSLERGSVEDVDRAEAVLEYLGETGQYPFAAAGRLIDYFHEKRQDWRAAQVFGRALHYFQQDQQYWTSTDELFDLVSASRDKLPPTLIVQAIRAILKSVRETEKTAATERSFPERTILLKSSKGEIRLPWGPTYLAFRLYPLAMNVDQKLAAEILRDDQELRRLTADKRPDELEAWMNASQHVVIGKATAERLQEIQQQSGAEQALCELTQLAAQDPALALKRARDFQEPSFRSRALAATAKHLGKADSTQAFSLLAEAESLLPKIDGLSDQIKSISEIAGAWAELKEVKRAAPLLNRGFTLALELYDQEKEGYRDDTPLFAPSAQSLLALIGVEASLDSLGAARRAQSISDGRVRASLVLQVGQHILEAEAGKARL